MLGVMHSLLFAMYFHVVLAFHCGQISQQANRKFLQLNVDMVPFLDDTALLWYFGV